MLEKEGKRGTEIETSSSIREREKLKEVHVVANELIVREELARNLKVL